MLFFNIKYCTVKSQTFRKVKAENHGSNVDRRATKGKPHKAYVITF